MSISQANRLFVFGTLLLIMAFGLATLRQSAVTGSSASAALAVISGGALVIERLLEAFWSWIDATRGRPWPLDLVSKAVDDASSSLDGRVKAWIGRVMVVVNQLATLVPQAAAIKAKLDEAKAAYDQDIASLTQFAQLSNEKRLQIQVDAFSRRMNVVLSQYPELSAAFGSDLDLAGDLLGATNEILASFADNPGRRLVSLYAGALIGISIAALLGLDVFAATGLTGTSTNLLRRLAVPMTGLIMGLGSNPTHEVIMALQAFKSRAGQRQPSA